MSGHGLLRSGSCARNAITPRRSSPSPDKRASRQLGFLLFPHSEKRTSQDLAPILGYVYAFLGVLRQNSACRFGRCKSARAYLTSPWKSPDRIAYWLGEPWAEIR